VTDKGQITLPADVLRAVNLRKGSELLLVQDGERVVLRKATDIGQAVIDDLEGWEALSLPALAETWDNPVDDEVWNDYGR